MKHFKFIAIILGLSLILGSCAKDNMKKDKPGSKLTDLTTLVVANIGECGSYTTPLIAGQDMEVGILIVQTFADHIELSYQLEGNWFLTESHLSVESDPLLIPIGQAGNPQVGNFLYAKYFDPYVQTYTYKVDIMESWDATVYIAAHGVVTEGFGASMEEFAAFLPEGEIQFSVSQPGDRRSYFVTDLIVDDEVSTFTAWCIDLNHYITPGVVYTGQMVSSYEDDYMGGELPENLDMVNWLVNQNFVGYYSSCDGNFTIGDVQDAIWVLVGDKSFDTQNCRVRELISAAMTNGSGFVPGCSDVVVVLLFPNPVNSVEKQLTFIEVPYLEFGLDCMTYEGEETIWAEGDPFVTQGSWAMIFKYCF